MRAILRTFLCAALGVLSPLGCAPDSVYEPQPGARNELSPEEQFDESRRSARLTVERAPGILNPVLRKASEVQLPANARVVGVLAGEPRAYLISAMTRPKRHIVNDLVQGKPVSVTYCDRKDCVRVYTSDTLEEPLPLSQGGYKNGMLLCYEEDFFSQGSGKHLDTDAQLPFATLPHEITTWDAWKRAHPKTKIYTGT